MKRGTRRAVGALDGVVFVGGVVSSASNFSLEGSACDCAELSSLGFVE